MSRLRALCEPLALASALLLLGCTSEPSGLLGLLNPREGPPPAADFELVARFVQVSDTHIVDVASPARFAGLDPVIGSAWRPQEAYSTQILDGTIRTVNRIHAGGETVDFLVHTGDATDNAQANELAWFLAVMDGALVTPCSGPDDRPVEMRPERTLDPFSPFQAQGLYQQSRHGDPPTIPWYAVLGNHDVLALGTVPIVEDAAGRRVAPLPLDWRPGLWLPVVLDPVGSLAYGAVTPAHPGPPPVLNCPQAVAANVERRYFDQPEFADALSQTQSQPAGHGLPARETGRTWYSAVPVPGLRLIVLDTATLTAPKPGCLYTKGALSRAQLDFLRTELAHAAGQGELAIVASHHPSDELSATDDGTVSGDELRAVLAGEPALVLHIAGHMHRNRVVQRAGYVEIETCATISPPMEARLIEIWRNTADGRIAIAYRMLSDLDDELPALGEDPLRPMRVVAHALAGSDKHPGRPRQDVSDSAAAETENAFTARGTAQDREGSVSLPAAHH